MGLQLHRVSQHHHRRLLVAATILLLAMASCTHAIRHMAQSVGPTLEHKQLSVTLYESKF